MPSCQANDYGRMPGHNHYGQACDIGVLPSGQPQSASFENGFCDLCEMEVDNGRWDFHLGTSKHLSRFNFVQYKAALEKAEADKQGITIEGVFDFDCISPQSAKSGVERLITIRASEDHARCILLSIKQPSSNSGFQATICGSSFMISASNSVTISVVFQQAFPGRYDGLLEFFFQDTQLTQQFVITRMLKAIVGDAKLLRELTPKEPYIPPKQNTKLEVGQVIKVGRSAPPKAMRYKAKLPKADIPKDLHDLLSSALPVAQLKKQIRQLCPASLTAITYRDIFKKILWIEEMEQDLDKHDMTDVALIRHHDNAYFLLVSGLADKRPEISIGDSILVQEKDVNSDKWFEGYVYSIRKGGVGLRFPPSFHELHEGKRFHIRFKLNRLSIRRQHQALDEVFFEDRILFPETKHLPQIGSIAKSFLHPYNPLIAGNEPQIQAILSILSLRPGSLPFIVYGPPGTGKTITIVEAMLQILALRSDSKILACAPSNSAADLIALRLASRLGPDQLFRFYAPSRSIDSMPDGLENYVYSDDSGTFTIPPDNDLAKFRVVVATCQSGSIAHCIGLPRGLFTHIFIDEAGQATEPETMVSIRTMADKQTNVVLSGDPKQLGPIIRSKVVMELAMELHLEHSYLERLMTRDAYDLKHYHSKSIIKLTKNFRSHQAILSFPNDRFYNGELEQCADPATTNTFLDTSILPCKNFPVVFHAVMGKDDRESTSPSFFNIDEITQVRYYVEKLMKHRKVSTAEEDIGIISPYHAQCSKLRASLKASDRLKIGSVEEFQGQERKVIIMSTVRSSKNFAECDLRHTLGFVADPRRFNVAITRAQALLIIVGDPNVLALDPLWRSFLNYVHKNGGWRGPDITWNPTEPVDEDRRYDRQIRQATSINMAEFTSRMQGLNMVGMEVEEEGED